MTRRHFAARMTALGSGAALAHTVLAHTALARTALAAGGDNGISRTAESIHQEVAIAAPPKRVYAALTDAAQFTKLTAIGGMKDVRPATIGRAEGEAFSLFGGVIIGRHIELVPDRRIVQAWRETAWEAGVYSLVKFELQAQAGGTLIVFDHTGFPRGAADHLAVGWGEHYWEPLKRLLSRA